MNFDKTSTKTATCNSKKFPATQRKKNSPIVRENRPTGNTACNRASCLAHDVTRHHHRRVSSWVMWLRMPRSTTSLPKHPFAFFIFRSNFLLSDQ